MAIKPFEIQGSTLTIGGVDLQAGTTSIVIPGVTRATNYTIEEVDDTGDQTVQFATNDSVVVVDYIQYQAILAETSGTFADFTAETDDEGYIDNIEVNGQGSYSEQESNRNGDEDMYAYNGAGSASDRPIVPEDWVRIPFRPKMRAGDVENLGGGGGSGLVERMVSFPEGESGDTAGTLALAPWGSMYVCTADYVNVGDYGGTYEVETSEIYEISQSGGTYNAINILAADYPEIAYIFNNTSDGALPGNWLVDAGGDFGSNNVCTMLGNANNETLTFYWPHRAGVDPEVLEEGYGALVIWDGPSIQQPRIWKQTDLGNLQLVDGYISRTRYQGGESSLDLESDDVQLEVDNNDNSIAKIRLNNTDTDATYVAVIVSAATEDTPPDYANEWKFKHDGSLEFPDGTLQTTAYTGQSTGGTPVAPLPDWLTVVSGTEHLPTINNDYGWDSNGVWTVNATIGGGGIGGEEGTSYPIRTTFTIASNLTSVTTVDFVVNNMGADFGIAVWTDGVAPTWQWDGTTGSQTANRIGAQYSGPGPELHGISGGAGGYGGWGLPATGTYRAKLTVAPTGPGVADITLQTLDTSDTVLDTITYTETAFTPEGQFYRIGFASDQDNGVDKVYFKNLDISIDGGTTSYSDALTSYSSVLAAGSNVLVNGDAVLTLETTGTLVFPDGSEQLTAYPAPLSSPSLVGSVTEQMTNNTQDTIQFSAAPRSVVVLASGCEVYDNEPVARITSITGLGLTWHKRAEYTDPDSTINSQRSEIWYAVNTSSLAASGTITITFDNTVDDQSTIVSNYIGCNLANPWTASGPSYSNNKSGVHATVTMNIAETNTTGIVFFAVPNTGTNNDSNGSVPGYASGWLDVNYRQNGSGEYWEYVNMSYKQFTDAQSNLVVTGTGDLTNDGQPIGLTVIADALVGGPGSLDRLTKGAHTVALEADGRLILGDGTSVIGRVNDEDVVFWANDTAEYTGMWYGGILDVNSDDYGPVAAITVGNTRNDDLYFGPGQGGTTGGNWNDGLQVNIDLLDKNWHFDGTTGDLTLPEETIIGSFTNSSANGGNYNQWMVSSVTGPNNVVYALGGESSTNEYFIIAHDNTELLWKRNFSQLDLNDNAGTNSPIGLNIKYDTLHEQIAVGFDCGNSTGVAFINPANGGLINSTIISAPDNGDGNGFISQKSFTLDSAGLPIIAGHSAGGWINHTGLTGTIGTDNGGNSYLDVPRNSLGNLNDLYPWSGNQWQVDRDGAGTWVEPNTLDLYAAMPTVYYNGTNYGGIKTATAGSEYTGANGSITGTDTYLEISAAEWTSITMLNEILAHPGDQHYTLVTGRLDPGAEHTVSTFSAIGAWYEFTSNVWRMDGNFSVLEGTGTWSGTPTNVLSISYGTTFLVDVGTYTNSTGGINYNYVSVSNPGTGYQSGDWLKVPGSSLGGVDGGFIGQGNVVAENGAFWYFNQIDHPSFNTDLVNGTLAHFQDGSAIGTVTAVTDAGDGNWRVAITITHGSAHSGTVYFFSGNDLTFQTDPQSNNIYNVVGVPAATTYRFMLNQTMVDQTEAGYSVRRVESQQAFIWTTNWAHTYGSLSNDEEFSDIAYDPLNNTVFAVGNFNDANTNANCLVLALNYADGTVQWEKFVGNANDGDYGYAKGVGVDAVGDVIVIANDDSGYALVTKLAGGDGTLVWQSVQTNQSNWNNEPMGVVDKASGDVYVGGSYYSNIFNHYMVSIMKLDGANGSLSWARNIDTVEQWWIYDQWDTFSQMFNVGNNQVQWAGYAADINNDYQDAIAVSLPSSGAGVGTYGRWVYSVDNDASWNTDNDAEVRDPTTQFDPTDALTFTINSTSASVYDANTSTITRFNISSGLPGIVFGDGSEIAHPGIGRHSVDNGDNSIMLSAEMNGKFRYFDNNPDNFNSSINIPLNADTPLPIGFTLTVVITADFNNSGVYVNSAWYGDSVKIRASGNSSSSNTWFFGGDGTPGIYTIMKVDTDSWMLAGPNVTVD